MKGTIAAEHPNARETVLNDPKERAEHHTVVDLLRNDLGTVASRIRVDRFRYVEAIQTHKGKLLQVSSEISGSVDETFFSNLGDRFFALLPAGSVSGAPKTATLRLIREAEGESRGFYTGVFGYFDGKTLDSGVLIRFMEQQGDEVFFRSGGGVTVFSAAEKEYAEVLQKIYLPGI